MAKRCPICEGRRAKRSCPGLAMSRWAGKGETICAPCCGAEREVRLATRRFSTLRKELEETVAQGYQVIGGLFGLQDVAILEKPLKE